LNASVFIDIPIFENPKRRKYQLNRKERHSGTKQFHHIYFDIHKVLG